MPTVFARKALLGRTWEDDVRLSIEQGRIARIETGSVRRDDESGVGIVIPGLCNAHSHAFQRALAGHTEYRAGNEHDSFWTWRERMYRLAGLIDAPALTAIARQAYTEMLSTGYTSVAEFHYLHSEPGRPADTAMLDAIVTAASEAGIRLTYVPVLYERAGFDQPQPKPEQRRFVHSLDGFLEHYDAAKSRVGERVSVAIGVHSLRAVGSASLARVAEASRADRCPMHLHVAEQQAEVEQSLDALGARPVAWLLDHADVDHRWNLVHATHMDDEELERLAATDAVVVLCPSTEANLGDGLFALRQWLQHDGNIAIGSDSHISINPFEELRWLEYGQRLTMQARNVAAIRRRHSGRSLFELACEGGAAACGSPPGLLKIGANADLVVLDDHNPMLSGHGTDSILDALVFSGFSLPIDRVMVNGDWQIVEGRHRKAQFARSEFNRVVSQLRDAGGGG